MTAISTLSEVVSCSVASLIAVIANAMASSIDKSSLYYSSKISIAADLPEPIAVD